jgi:hypothetical protein
MSIKQLNTTYLLQEDRILFRINTHTNEEFVFLLTRRVTLFLLAATEHLVEKQLEQHHDPATAKAVADFEKKSLVDIGNAGTEFEAGETFPLGQPSLLVLEVTCSIAPPDQATSEALFSIDFALASDQSINLKLAKSMLISLRLLLENLCDHASWGRAVITANPVDVFAASVYVDIPGGSSSVH